MTVKEKTKSRSGGRRHLPYAKGGSCSTLIDADQYPSISGGTQSVCSKCCWRWNETITNKPCGTYFLIVLPQVCRFRWLLTSFWVFSPPCCYGVAMATGTQMAVNLISAFPNPPLLLTASMQAALRVGKRCFSADRYGSVVIVLGDIALRPIPGQLVSNHGKQPSGEFRLDILCFH